jgi:hypothetical protein
VPAASAAAHTLAAWNAAAVGRIEGRRPKEESIRRSIDGTVL